MFRGSKTCARAGGKPELEASFYGPLTDARAGGKRASFYGPLTVVSISIVRSESNVWQYGLLSPGPFRPSGPGCLGAPRPAPEQEESQDLKLVWFEATFLVSSETDVCHSGLRALGLCRPAGQEQASKLEMQESKPNENLKLVSTVP